MVRAWIIRILLFSILTTKEGTLMVTQSLLFSTLLKCYYFSAVYPNKKNLYKFSPSAVSAGAKPK